jgi:hypothetical protein
MLDEPGLDVNGDHCLSDVDNRRRSDSGRPVGFKRPNVAFGASSAPNVAFGALDATNATLGRMVPGPTRW